MDADKEPLTSTTWVWKKVKIRQSAGGHGHSTRAKRGFLRLGRSPRHLPVRVTLTYKGGAESWWLVQARGESQVFSGSTALEDVMARVLSER